jgi:hypothetical protein
LDTVPVAVTLTVASQVLAAFTVTLEVTVVFTGRVTLLVAVQVTVTKKGFSDVAFTSKFFDPLVWYVADAVMQGTGKCRGDRHTNSIAKSDSVGHGAGYGDPLCEGEPSGSGYGSESGNGLGSGYGTSRGNGNGYSYSYLKTRNVRHF